MVDWDLDEVERVSVIRGADLENNETDVFPVWVCNQCTIGCRVVSKNKPTECMRPMPKPDWVSE